ncbi:C40 family peptidase [Flavobacterium sp.]|uniref:C40 family peptidase n=1 Tax=Flavobacterium sp. TaxID=239 RepID=UPI002488F874|nr:C40 family peptidase [Flavobacterium sp.]MDI1317481.1 C40 family peptidase [Flavobacterium sp.]
MSIIKIITVTSIMLIGLFVAITSLKETKSWRLKNVTSSKETLLNSNKNQTTLRDSVVSYGTELLGTPYVAAGCSTNGFDCSGFVYYVFKHFKIEVPRSSPQYKNFGKEVPINNVKKGDILVFLSPTNNVIGHLGIVTNPKGMDSDFIHSTSGREMKVVITSLKVEGYKQRFVKAISVLN